MVAISVDRIADAVVGSATEKIGATIVPKLGVRPEDALGFESSLADLQAIASVLSGSGPPFPNELRDFASYNYIFSFGCLNNFEINFPDVTYRRSDPSILILKSGGGAGSGGRTAAETGGKTEYYIDDVEINTIVGANPRTGQSNAVQIDFKITEPYSMGMFLQALQVASIRSGHKNYLEAPWVLAVEFKGWDQNGNSIRKPGTRRIFPLKLVNIGFEVNEGGSVYNVKAIPWHESAMNNDVQGLKTDVQISGRTLQEILQTGGASLTQHINRRLQEMKKSKEVITPDEFVILFPKNRSSATENLAGSSDQVDSATVNPSDKTDQREISAEDKRKIFESVGGESDADLPEDFDAQLSKLLGIVVKRSKIGEAIRELAEKEENTNDIGKAEIVQSFLEGGKQPFGKPSFSEVKDKPGLIERGKIQINNKTRSFTFKSGTTIQEMVEELVILSDYGKKIMEESEKTKDGMIPWFKVEADVYNITDMKHQDLTGTSPKVYVYRVVPYKAHISRFQPPTAASPGIDYLNKQCCKEYDYIYTGKNDDILDFDINFDVAFFTSITPFGGKNKYGSKNADQNTAVKQEDKPEKTKQEGTTDNLSSSGNTTSKEGTEANQSTGKKGGGGDLMSPEVQVARDFNEALVNSPVDLITARMTIWGDPYYIADSGMGNYNAPETPLINLTKDGTMDYQSSEVDLRLNFRTPLDYSLDGTMDFPSVGFQPVGAFSGVYQIIFVLNRFSEGVFTQDLKLIRRKNQPGGDTNAKPTTGGNIAVKDNPDKKKKGTSSGPTGQSPGAMGGPVAKNKGQGEGANTAGPVFDYDNAGAF